MKKYHTLLFCLVLPICFTPLFSQTDSAVKSKSILLIPLIAKSIETGWSAGAAVSATFRLSKADTAFRTSNFQSLFLYSANKQAVLAVNGSIYFPGEKYILNHQLSYSSYPDKFWGLGKHAPDNAEESYKFRQYYIYLHLLKKLNRHLFIGTLFELQKVLNVQYNKGGLFDKDNIAGRHGYLAAGLGLSLTYDTRNNSFSPDKGMFAQTYFNHFDPVFGSQFKYTNVVVDIRKFYRVYKRQVLAFQAFSFSNIGREIPLRSLASLGGANSMRGYYAGRYRDKQQLVLQSEYRVPVIGRFGVVAFGGLGDVGHTVFDFQADNFKYSYGGGIRFAINKKEKLNLRLDYGFGNKNNNGLYFQLGEAF